MAKTAPAAARNDREPQPVDRVTTAEGGSVKIDGAHQAKEINPRRREGPPRTVAAELTLVMAPGATRIAVLEGGPADGVEARIARGAGEYRVPCARTEGAGPIGMAPSPSGKVQQTVVGGDYASAVYLRSDRQDDDGRPVYEFAGVE